MPAIMRVIGFANGAPCLVKNQWLKTFDFEDNFGVGYGEFTDDPAEAIKFENAGALMEFWKRPSKVRPLRADLRPNRPLTAASVTIDYVD
jgi:hypothetical protein